MKKMMMMMMMMMTMVIMDHTEIKKISSSTFNLEDFLGDSAEHCDWIKPSANPGAKNEPF